ncbi:hypothetical protein THAOC_24992, partial [Thalassiosira oceanica]
SRKRGADDERPIDSKRAEPLSNSTLLEALDNDLLIRCASYLDADGLARLGRASTAFGTPQAGQQRSLANEAAHQRFQRSATDEERGCLPKHDDESDIGLYRALEQLREPLSFDELAGYGFGLQEHHPARITCTGRGHWSTAVSGHAMRGGRHFVEFAITSIDQYASIYLGVIRPVSLTNGIDLDADWRGDVDPVLVTSRSKPAVSEKLRSQRTSKWGDSDIHCCVLHCIYNCWNGHCHGTDWDTKVTNDDWQGLEGLVGSGTIGLLLDLDEGTLSVFKNNRRLGVTKRGGLSGEYCWFVSVYSNIHPARSLTMSGGPRGDVRHGIAATEEGLIQGGRCGKASNLEGIEAAFQKAADGKWPRTAEGYFCPICFLSVELPPGIIQWSTFAT